MKQTIALIFLLLTALSAQAQLEAVVANMETGVPIRDAVIYTNEGVDTLTKWDGTFCLKDTFQRFTVSHPAFIGRIVDAGDFHNGDTIKLIPKEGYIGEVTVWGKKRKIEFDMKTNSVDAQLQRSTLQGFNPLGLLQLIGKKGGSSKKRNKLKEVLDNY